MLEEKQFVLCAVRPHQEAKVSLAAANCCTGKSESWWRQMQCCLIVGDSATFSDRLLWEDIYSVSSAIMRAREGC